MIRRWYISGPKMTVQANTKDGIIIWTAPVVRRFCGQPVLNLLRWMKADRVCEIGAKP